MTQFEGIEPALAVALEKRGYSELTPVQKAVLDSEHRLLYMRNAARVHEESNPVSQTLTYTQQAAHVSTTQTDGTQPLLDVKV